MRCPYLLEFWAIPVVTGVFRNAGFDKNIICRPESCNRDDSNMTKNIAIPKLEVEVQGKF